MNKEWDSFVQQVKLGHALWRTEYSSDGYVQVRYALSTKKFEIEIKEVNYFDHPESRFFYLNEEDFLQYLIDYTAEFGEWRVL